MSKFQVVFEKQVYYLNNKMLTAKQLSNEEHNFLLYLVIHSDALFKQMKRLKRPFQTYGWKRREVCFSGKICRLIFSKFWSYLQPDGRQLLFKLSSNGCFFFYKEKQIFSLSGKEVTSQITNSKNWTPLGVLFAKHWWELSAKFRPSLLPTITRSALSLFWSKFIKFKQVWITQIHPAQQRHTSQLQSYCLLAPSNCKISGATYHKVLMYHQLLEI